jgi:uncharacterized protein YndB with AHSA1/START domain
VWDDLFNQHVCGFVGSGVQSGKRREKTTRATAAVHEFAIRSNNKTLELDVVKSVEISASTNDVWRALTEPDKIAQWMGGARVESKWEIGGEITFIGEMTNFNKTYHDRGTALTIECEKLLKYSHWTALSRLPDASENRTLITFSLDWTSHATRLTVRHECLYSEAAYKHADFFWGIALTDVKNLLER